MLIKQLTICFLCLVSFSIYGESIRTDDSTLLEDGWGDDEWSEEESDKSMLDQDIGGFIEMSYGEFTSTNPVKSSQSIYELRAQLEIADFLRTIIDSDDISSFVKFDLYKDRAIEESGIDFREIYLGYNLEEVDIRFGRQVLSWGTGDKVFLNDLFAKDWNSFFSGRDLSYLKVPTDAVRVAIYKDVTNTEIIWVPIFTPDEYVNGERFSYFDRNSGEIVGSKNIAVDEPEKNIKNSEVSLRVFRDISSYELSLYAYRGFFKQPVGYEENINKAFFPRMNSVGASGRGAVFGGLANVEASWYESKDDKQGVDPLIANSQLRFLVGYEKEVIQRFDVGLQYYLEKTAHYKNQLQTSNNPVFEQSERRHLFTLSLNYRMMRDKLNLYAYRMQSFDEDDSYTLIKINYRVNDIFNIEFGGNVFAGKKKYTFLGQFENNDNAYIRVRMSY